MPSKKRRVIALIFLVTYILFRIKAIGLGQRIDPLLISYGLIDLNTFLNYVLLVPTILLGFFGVDRLKKHFQFLGAALICFQILNWVFKLNGWIYFKPFADFGYFAPLLTLGALSNLSVRIVFGLITFYTVLLYANSQFAASFMKPMGFSDMNMLSDYLTVLPALQKWAVIGGFFIVFLSLIALYRFKNEKWKRNTAGTFALLTLFYYYPALPINWGDYGHTFPYEHLQNHGYLSSLILQPRQTYGKVLQTEVDQADQLIGQAPLHRLKLTHENFRKRNVYIFLLESIADISEKISVSNISQKPNSIFSNSFVQLWSKTHRSHILVPVFGGRTAQSEFEMMCGVPSNLFQGLAFNDYVKKPFHCLPQILAEKGYETEIWHGFKHDLFKGNKVYPFLGMKQIFDRSNLLQNESKMISDDDLFSEMMKHSKEIKEPHILYLNTSTAHMPYFNVNDSLLSNEAKELLSSLHETDGETRGYLRNAFESTQLFAKWFQRIEAIDPDAIIIAYGDHLPPLPKFWPKFFSGEMSTDQWISKQSTPIILKDGKNGFIEIQNQPLYLIPYLVLNLLQEKPFQFDSFNSIRPTDSPLLAKTTSKNWETRTDLKDPPRHAYEIWFRELAEGIRY